MAARFGNYAQGLAARCPTRRPPPSVPRPQRLARVGASRVVWQVSLQGFTCPAQRRPGPEAHSGDAVYPSVSKASAGGPSAQLHGPSSAWRPAAASMLGGQARAPASVVLLKLDTHRVPITAATLTRRAGSNGNSCRYEQHPARLRSNKAPRHAPVPERSVHGASLYN